MFIDPFPLVVIRTFDRFSKLTLPLVFFFYLDFLLRTFMIHRTTGEGVGYLFNSSLPLPPASQLLQRGHLCTYLEARLEPRTFGFPAQVTNQQATRPRKAPCMPY